MKTLLGISTVLLLISMLFGMTYANAETRLLGYVHDPKCFYDDAPLSRNYKWKAFRYRSSVSGTMDFFRFYLGGFRDHVETDNDVGWAVYEDNNGRVGPLKVSGHSSHYNWMLKGIGTHHDFPVTMVHQNRNVTSGNYYWLTFFASGEDNILLSRGNQCGCNDNLRCATDQNSWKRLDLPPPSHEFDVLGYGLGCYGWSVWQSEESSDQELLISTPTGTAQFAFTPVISPVMATDPSYAKPIGIGTAATGGDTLSLAVATHTFTSPVDVYFAFDCPSIYPATVYVLRQDNTVQTLGRDLVPWRSNVTVFNESLFGDISIAGFPSLRCNFYLAVTPFQDLSRYYLWTTYMENH